jgi:radical SAM protein with 4Fe4S-binding SPASM domain
MDDIYATRNVPFRRVEHLSIVHLGERRLYFNETATAIWSLLDGHRSLDEVTERLRASTRAAAATPEQIAASVRQFVQTLQHLTLAHPVRPAQAAPPGAEANGDPAPAAVAAPRPAGAQPASDTPMPMACATVRQKRGALSIRESKKGANDPESPIEDRFNDLYWDRLYIQKMHLELTYRCNFRCVQCYNTTHAATTTEMTVAEWRTTLEQLARLGCHTATFTGGEVFVRKDAPEILQAACDQGFSFRINTNGSLINEALLRRLEPMRAFVQAFDVSFYGATAEVHDTLARRIGGYQATRRAVQLLKDAGFKVHAKFITMRDNFDGMADWKQDMHDIGVPSVVANGTLIPRTDRNTAPLTQLLTDKQHLELMAISPLDEEGGAHGCRPGHIRGAITPDGFVSPCEWLTDFKFGNLRERSLEDIWYSENSAAFRRIFEEESECPSCSLRPGCTRCPAHSYLETGHLLACAPSPRHYAEIYQQARQA